MLTRRGESGESWSGGGAFLVACTGAAVGLGSVWRLPYLFSEHGGSAFLAVYLAALALVGVPALIAEWLPARRTRASLPTAYRDMVRDAQAAAPWRLLPWLALLTGLLVLATLGVFGGWTLAYLGEAVRGRLAVSGPREAVLLFDGLARDPGRAVAAQTLFLGVAAVVSAAGLRRGIEAASRVLLTLLIAFLLAMLALAEAGGTLRTGLDALLAFEPGRLGWDGVFAALGHAAFTFMLGVGALHAYAAHPLIGMPLTRLAVQLAVLDTLLAVACAVAVTGLLASGGQAPLPGTRLLLEAIPQLAAESPGGGWTAVPLLGALAVAGWLAAIALLEPAVTRLTARGALSRPAAVAWVAGLAWAAGLAVLLPLADGAGGPWWLGADLLANAVDLTGRVLVPLSMLLGALFVGWVLPDGSRRNELLLVPLPLYRLWIALLRYAVPPLLLLVFLAGTGILGTPR